MTFTTKRGRVIGKTLEDASVEMLKANMNFHGRSSRWDGIIFCDGIPVRNISYNGRIWNLISITPQEAENRHTDTIAVRVNGKCHSFMEIEA
jgi:hypothetical protein